MTERTMERNERDRLLRHFTTGVMVVEPMGVLEGGDFRTAYVAKVGGKVLAMAGEDFRHETRKRARDYGERVRAAMRAALADSAAPAGATHEREE
ncbi:MAG TPA: hypothetical protein VFI96_06260 [Longimicrobiaceae bacterium]|nr:hypothetical protein [Longimicrobiaceae bacterium]